MKIVRPDILWSHDLVSEGLGVSNSYSFVILRTKVPLYRKGKMGVNKTLARKGDVIRFYKGRKSTRLKEGAKVRLKLKARDLIKRRKGDIVPIYSGPPAEHGLLGYAKLKERLERDKRFGLERWLVEWPDGSVSKQTILIRRDLISTHDDLIEEGNHEQDFSED